VYSCTLSPWRAITHLIVTSGLFLHHADLVGIRCAPPAFWPIWSPCLRPAHWHHASACFWTLLYLNLGFLICYCYFGSTHTPLPCALLLACFSAFSSALTLGELHAPRAQVGAFTTTAADFWFPWRLACPCSYDCGRGSQPAASLHHSPGHPCLRRHIPSELHAQSIPLASSSFRLDVRALRLPPLLPGLRGPFTMLRASLVLLMIFLLPCISRAFPSMISWSFRE